MKTLMIPKNWTSTIEISFDNLKQFSKKKKEIQKSAFIIAIALFADILLFLNNKHNNNECTLLAK